MTFPSNLHPRIKYILYNRVVFPAFANPTIRMLNERSLLNSFPQIDVKIEPITILIIYHYSSTPFLAPVSISPVFSLALFPYNGQFVPSVNDHSFSLSFFVVAFSSCMHTSIRLWSEPASHCFPFSSIVIFTNFCAIFPFIKT